MSDNLKYIEVAVVLPVEGTFTYRVPDALSLLAEPGKRVLVPFGSRKITGYILGDAIPSDHYEIKLILDILDDAPLFPESMLAFFKWISEYYLHPIGQVVQCALPKGLTLCDAAEIALTDQGKTALSDSLNPLEQKVLKQLETGGVSLKTLIKKCNITTSLIQLMQRRGWIVRQQKLKGAKRKRKTFKDPFGEPIEPDTAPILTTEQHEAVSRITDALSKGFSGWLLAGVTGSGKTEVYMRLAAQIIRQGLGVIVLVPEIALISQTERRFRARFGECVAVLHSSLSGGERYSQWRRIAQGQATIAIGARSAVFAPFDKIGLIIVDEEHDSSYKQDNDLLYNARDLALVRAKLSDCPAILGSATPSIQTYYNAGIEKLTELNLNCRVQERPMPQISVVDLRKIRDFRGIRRFISPELHQAMSQTLSKNEQVLLFLNRRGFAAFPVCAECGASLRCEHCDISMTLHKGDNAYKCHFCGFSRSSGANCPTCGSYNIKFLGLGTERVEEAVKALFPQARVARMDRDTTSKKGALLNILKDLRQNKIDILVGTQMVAKGHDFPNITLVGIICADLTLNLPDFRAGEQTFQLLAQVSGRAGRGDAPGRVILQTYAPNHFSIVSAQAQDFKAFCQREIQSRQALNYPPFSRLIQLRISGQDAEQVQEFADALGGICRELKKNASFFHAITILGPAESPISRIAGHYRWQILLKSTSSKLLHEFSRHLLAQKSVLPHHRQILLIADVDPLFLA
ncbi:MAG: primosomal protein N' [Desulfobacteraceae bacterium IS3]|nr:MAG: primosomal protein N' [Desulfobacteraceae bacterium IS3]